MAVTFTLHDLFYQIILLKMEDENTASSSSSDLQTMDESLEFIFKTMIGQGDMLDAVEFIRSIEVNFLPSKAMVKILVFDILMKNDNVRTLAYAENYLSTLIDVFPPINEKRREFYFDSFRDSHGVLADLWTLFTHIVNSYFCHRSIYVVDTKGNSTDPIKYPNCKFLLELYMKLFSADFEHYDSDRADSCLLMKLFWPNSDIRNIGLNNQTDILLKWINDIYASSFSNEMGDLLLSMHDMLTLVVRCIIERRYKLSQCTAFSSGALAEIVESILNCCNDAFSNLPNVRRFLAFIFLKYLQAKICERIIKQIIKINCNKYSVLTLKDIIDQCMFPSRLNKPKTNKSVVNKEKALRKRSIDKKYFADMKMETTKLHELCKNNKFADLFEELKLADDINVRDLAGNTPLHEACSTGSKLCIRNLIDAGVTQTLDYGAFNLKGITPLHVAVMNDFVDIAKTLLSHGGPELLTLADISGHTPAELSKSDSMKQLLQEYDVKLKDSTAEVESSAEKDSKNSKDNQTPLLKTFKEYSIYVDALNCLLCTYCVMFNLYNYVWKRDIVVSSHTDNCCCHFIDNDVCSEDADVILEMPALIETFIESISKNAAKSEYTIDIELIPLKGFAASLKKS